MTEKGKRNKRDNIYFRQTPKSFAEARQTKALAFLNRNIPYTIYKATRDRFSIQVQKIHSNLSRWSTKLPGINREKSSRV